jgi:hypothetical protein
MALFDGGDGDDLGGRGGFEVVDHIGFEGRVIALEGET